MIPLAERPESQCLAHVASIYFEAKERRGDHRQAFAETIRRALQEGYQPLTCWVTTAMLAAGRPTHAVVLGHTDSAAVYPITVGGVSINRMVALEDEMFSLERGWRLIEGEALDIYLAWAREESRHVTNPANL
ncbi:hypothetical protein [Pseudomonas aeruginosa]|uniref:hypothetical protein n=1 Tax=Pseudomonas aeruginosa TaxID=287 RepID=UPI002F42F50B